MFQPIVSTLDGTIVGVEALSRFADRRPPAAHFAEENARGTGVALELRAVELALEAAVTNLGPDVYVAVNVSPATMVSPLLPALVRGRPFRVVIELTEHDRVDDYDELIGAVEALRALGVGLAVDDAGSGYAGLAHILRVRPDYIKLDRELVSGIDSDPAKLALSSAAADFGPAAGAEVIAEGIETIEEFDALVSVGIRFGQGYLFARPHALPVEVDRVVSAVRQPRVLIVDDDAVVRTFLRMTLEKAGFVIVGEAEDASAAIDRARALAPDVVLLDIELPSMRGDDAIPHIRAVAPNVAVILVSGSGATPTGRIAADGYVSKRSGVVGVGAVVRTILANRRSPQHRRPMKWTSEAAATGSAHGRSGIGNPLDPRVTADLQALAETNRTGVVALIHAYIADIEAGIEELAALADAGDADSLSRVAHRLTGSSAAVSAVRVADGCRRVETLAAAGDWTGARVVIDELHRDVVAAVAALRQTFLSDTDPST